ncbi:MAG: adenine deaminase, partial [Clostridia bacterium]|nr:adenine deaminase [Clostridia bacterium]
MGKRPCTMAVENVQLVNVFSGEIYPATVYVYDGFIAHIAKGQSADRSLALEIVDGKGAYLTPGLIDPHIHIESTMLTPRGFAAAAVPHGTTTVVTDPHELANVLGEEAVVYMHDAGEDLPMRQLIDIPSCVPSVPGLENAGAEFDAAVIRRLAKLPRVIGLAEVMDFLAVADGESRMLEIIEAAEEEGLYLQGHLPTMDDRLLSAYVIGGPTTCHETRTAEAAVEKIRVGLHVDARESSIAKDIAAVWSGVKNLRYLDRISLCTDDREAHDILENGHMDNALRKAVACGIDPVDALLESVSAETPRHLLVVTSDPVAADTAFASVTKRLAPGSTLDIMPYPEVGLDLRACIRNYSTLGKSYPVTELLLDEDAEVIEQLSETLRQIRDDVAEGDEILRRGISQDFKIVNQTDALVRSCYSLLRRENRFTHDIAYI